MSSSPEKLTDLGGGLEIWRIDPRKIREQDKNARVQTSTTFKRGVSNVKKRGALESLPFVHRQGEDFYAISGHHRIRWAIQAELESIAVLADSSPLTRSELVAKQIAHNSIAGTDDPAVLLQLMSEIDNVEALIEASVDRAELEKLVKQDVKVPDVTVDYSWRTLQFAFLPTQLEDFEALCLRLTGSDLVGTVPVEIHEEFLKTMKRVSKVDDVRSVGSIIYRMMEIAKEYLDKRELEVAEQPVEGHVDG